MCTGTGSLGGLGESFALWKLTETDASALVFMASGTNTATELAATTTEGVGIALRDSNDASLNSSSNALTLWRSISESFHSKLKSKLNNYGIFRKNEKNSDIVNSRAGHATIFKLRDNDNATT